MRITSNQPPDTTPKEYPKNNYAQNAVGLAVPLAIECGIGMPIEVAIQNKLVKSANVPEIDTYLNKAFNESNLGQTGLKIISYKVNDKNTTYLQKAYSLLNLEAGAKCGRNAGYVPILNTLIVPYKKLQGAFFHEMGHAMNKNFNQLLKVIQYSKPIFSNAALAIGITGICTSIKHPAKDEELSRTDKIKNFIHNNAGKLVLATSAPILIEEFLASAKGNKLAEKVMPESLVKTVKKTNLYGGICYLTSAVISAIAIAAGIKIKDYLVYKKHQKMQNELAE